MAQPQSHIPLPMATAAPTPNYSHAAAATPTQQSPSPAQSQPAFSMPPMKRPRLSPGPGSQPQSPYGPVSPGATGTLTPTSATAAPSPQFFSAIPLPTSTAAHTNSLTSYTNGHSMNIPLPDPRPQVPLLATPQAPSQTPMPTPTTSAAPYTTASMAPIAAATGSISMPPMPSPATPGTMGPPSRPPERPAKEIEYEPDDMLAGTGIDLREEEQLQAKYLYGDDARHGFGQYPPGDKSSFYGAGPMNQPPQAINGQSQNEFLANTAGKQWREAAYKLAQTRSNELNDPFIQISRVFARAEKIAKEHGVTLNKETKKDNSPPLGRMRMPEDIQQPTVHVATKTLPDMTVVNTYGSVIPQDAFLVDQLALMSIACKQRMRVMLDDAWRISQNRQLSSHGEIPEEWRDVAAPLKGMDEVVAEEQREDEQQDMAVPDSAVSPRTNPLKRPADGAGTNTSTEHAAAPPPKLQKVDKNTMVSTLREMAKTEREWEEIRLRRRQARKDGTTETGGTGSRAGSVAPGTPGSTAPEPGSKKEGMTKKEQRKSAAAKATDASTSQASQNQTSNMFMGKMGGLFGKKKSYGWMTGGSRSGSSTPARPGTPGPLQSGGLVNAQPEPAPLTSEGRNRLGLWREDRDKGRNIQLRDWVAVLEADRLDPVALQVAYNKLDSSGPK